MNQTRSILDSAESYRIQKTLLRETVFGGVGIHSGEKCRLRVLPAGAHHGIQFFRTDLGKPVAIPAHYQAVVSTSLATTLGLGEHKVHTVEHVLAALFGLGITNARLELEGSEIPILDGSAVPFIDAFLDAGLAPQPYTASVLKILKPIKVYENDAICELLPRDGLRLTTSVDFPHPSIGLQTFALELSPRAFIDEVCRARTFGFYKDLDRLRAKQLALGASLENVLAFSDEGVINVEGMRFPNECVRHKLLDALGDLSLCGSWIEGEMVSYRGGHAMHLNLLRALADHPQNWKIIRAESLKSPTHLDSFSEGLALSTI